MNLLHQMSIKSLELKQNICFKQRCNSIPGAMRKREEIRREKKDEMQESGVFGQVTKGKSILRDSGHAPCQIRLEQITQRKIRFSSLLPWRCRMNQKFQDMRSAIIHLVL